MVVAWMLNGGGLNLKGERTRARARCKRMDWQGSIEKFRDELLLTVVSSRSFELW